MAFILLYVRFLRNFCEKANITEFMLFPFKLNVTPKTHTFYCLFQSGNHYAAQHIRTVASRLDRTWKEFAAGLDERTSVLGLSVLFHHKAEQYCDSVASWAAACEATQPPPSEIQSLETAIRTHQSLYEAMCQAYTEVSTVAVHKQHSNIIFLRDHNFISKQNVPNSRAFSNLKQRKIYSIYFNFCKFSTSFLFFVKFVVNFFYCF